MSERHSRHPNGGPPAAPEPLPPYVRERPDGCCLRVHVQPRAKRPGLAGTHGDRLKLRVAAPPADGAANAACIQAVADLLGIPPSAVTLVRGATSREKDLAIAGVTGDRAAAALATAP